jgi:hypothetical protein
MKIREVLKLTDRRLSGAARSVTADKTPTVVAPIRIPNRLVGLQKRPGSPDILPNADRDDGINGDLPPALDQSPTSLAPISTPHRPDLDFIKAQIAQLPRHTEQQTNLPASAGVNSGASSSRNR